MKHQLPFFNWSLSKLLATETDSLKRARISILFTISIFSFLKVVIALVIGLYFHQDLQLLRSIFFISVIIILIKFQLTDKKHTVWISVIYIWIALLLTWSNVFVTAQTINIVTVQVVVMIILSSFYLLNWRWALAYSFFSLLPIILLLIIGQGVTVANIAPDQLASPGYEIIVVLNFLTIVIAHFLYYQALTNNIQEKEILNRQLHAAVKEANMAVESKADFLSTMSHELRTPLNSVIGMTQLLLNSPYSSEQAENLKIVNFSAMNLHMLINDILDFNKMESDMLTLETITVDLNRLVSDIALGMRFQAEEKDLQLIVDIDDELSTILVISDPTRLTQIIHNLLSNAIKFTAAGNVTLGLKVAKLNNDSMTVHFSVSDTGIGISTEKQELIFEAFTQASSSTTRHFGGTGLGLTIVKRLLKLFGSEIDVASSEGSGSEFFFDIDFKIAASVKDSLTLEREIEYDLAGLNVLVVEDNPINSLLIKKIFLNWNNNPVFAMNGQEAIEKVRLNSYDVILMDIHMPLLDGYETTKLIRKMDDSSKSSIPIIALTASVSDDLYTKIRDAGMNDYINKPFKSDDLYQKLKAINVAFPVLLTGGTD